MDPFLNLTKSSKTPRGSVIMEAFARALMGKFTRSAATEMAVHSLPAKEAKGAQAAAVRSLAHGAAEGSYAALTQDRR